MFIRRAASGDADGIRRVSLATDQPESESGADESYLNLLLDTARVVVAEDLTDGIVGWGASRSTRLGSLLTDLFVDPIHQGIGTGQAILRHLWPELRETDHRYTFSSRHPHALPLYVRAGLIPRWPLLYIEGRTHRSTDCALSTYRVSAEAAARGEEELFGEDRHADYRFWTRWNRSSGVLVCQGEQVIAVAAIRPGELVHLVCTLDADPAAVLHAVLAACPGQTKLCLPGPHVALEALLGARFRVLDYDFAMTTPELALPTHWVYSPGLG